MTIPPQKGRMGCDPKSDILTLNLVEVELALLSRDVVAIHLMVSVQLEISSKTQLFKREWWQQLLIKFFSACLMRRHTPWQNLWQMHAPDLNYKSLSTRKSHGCLILIWVSRAETFSFAISHHFLIFDCWNFMTFMMYHVSRIMYHVSCIKYHVSCM